MPEVEFSLPDAALPSWEQMLAHLNGLPCVPPSLSPRDASHRRRVSFEVLEDRED